MNPIAAKAGDLLALETLPRETPFFGFSRERIVANYRRFRECFPGCLVYYAMKANSEPAVLEILRDAGSGFEAASAYELETLKAMNVPADRIIYGTSIKPQMHIKRFFDYGVRTFAFDCIDELHKIAMAAPASSVYVRVAVDDSDSVFRFSEKFGADAEDVLLLAQEAIQLGLNMCGVSFHVGSQASTSTAWANALHAIAKPLAELRDAKIEIEFINLGGGFPCNYASNVSVPSIEEIADATLERYSGLSHKPRLVVEPGRGLVADAGILVASVIGKVERRGKTWLFLDAGAYNGLFEAMAYQGSTRYPIKRVRSADGVGEATFALAGPTGDAPDIITRDALLPRDMCVGDRLAIRNVGAYTLPFANTFNGFPMPPVYFGS